MAQNYKGLTYMREKLKGKRKGVLKRYEYYDMHNLVRDWQISTPPQLRSISITCGWCAKAVDALADRLVFREFRYDDFNFNEIYQRNNKDVLMPSAIKSALIASCCFIYLSRDEDGYPRLQVVDGGNATGTVDPITGMLTEGYAVLERDGSGKPIYEAYFTAGRTDEIDMDGNVKTYYYPCAYPLLVPVIYKPDASRPFGHSRISRACMDYTQSAMRTIKRSEISAEFYSFPQKYATGLSNDLEGLDSWRATMSSMLLFTKDEEGDTPKLGQFAQQSFNPHTDDLKMIASLFAGETGLTLDDLGFSTANPSSSEAIKAAHENLRAAGRTAMGSFGVGLKNAGFVAACIRDNFAYKRSAIYQVEPIWEPLFEPDGAALGMIGDGANKINQAIPGYFNADTLRDLTGIRAAESEA